jgi:hypothetical protein
MLIEPIIKSTVKADKTILTTNVNFIMFKLLVVLSDLGLLSEYLVGRQVIMLNRILSESELQQIIDSNFINDNVKLEIA